MVSEGGWMCRLMPFEAVARPGEARKIKARLALYLHVNLNDPEMCLMGQFDVL